MKIIDVDEAAALNAMYDQVQEIYRSARTLVCRARRRGDGHALVVKTPRAAIPDADEIARYRREFSLLSGWELLGVARALGLEETGGRTYLELEDSGGRSLADWLSRREFSPLEVVELLIQLAEALQSLHSRGIVHNDVNPHNLIWAPDQRVMLIDFSCSLTHPVTFASDPGEIQGNPRYLSPERTGRIHRDVDHRSDLYSLGATAWHLLVGRPPFEAIQDPVALVHAQLARNLPPACSLAPQVPPSLSAIVATLLCKDPKMRYQSVTGLVLDLNLCRSDPQADFELKRGDHREMFALPDGLYGRAQETRILHEGLAESARGGRVVLLISGPAGVGKTSLVLQLAEARGLFASGRHELLKRDQPYLALVNALGQALRQLLTGSETELVEWHTRVSAAVGKHSGFLVRLLPDLRYFLEELHDVPELSSEEGRNRTHLAFSSLVRSLARSECPLILFLDDLQWADGASLELLEFLATDPDIEGLLLVAGYRDGDGAFPLSTFLQEVEGRVSLRRLRIAELDLDCTIQLVADTCGCQTSEAAPLASLLHDKTAGNPFFLKAVLRELHDQGRLTRGEAGWVWNSGDPLALDISPNVVDFKIKQMRALPPETAHALSLAACFGHRFSAGWLAAALKCSRPQVAAGLWPALQRGLVLPLGNEYRLLEFGGEAEAWYRFSHDRVQEAAYQLLDERLRESVHLDLGRLLLSRLPDPQESELLFPILDHLHKGLGHMEDPAERRRFAGLALSAGRRAWSSAAFDTAFTLAEAGHRALGEHRWSEHYELTLGLVSDSARAALATRHFEALEVRLSELSQQARTFADQIPVWILRLQSLLEEDRMAEAFELSDDFLRRTGRSQPRSGNPLVVALALLQTMVAIGRRSPEELLDLPQTHDPVLVGIQDVQTRAALAQARVQPHTIPLGILRDVRTVLSDGLTARGAQCWTGYGLILCRLGQVPLGIRYAQLALNQVDRLGRAEVWPRVASLAYLLVFPWGTPLGEVTSLLRNVVTRALEVGDMWSASHAAVVGDGLDYHRGAPLASLGPRLERTEKTLAHLRRADTRLPFAFLRRAVRELAMPLAGPPAWLGETRQLDWSQDPLGHVGTMGLELQLAQIFGQTRVAFEIARSPHPGMLGPTVGAFEFIYQTYALVALLRGVEEGWIGWLGVQARLHTGLAVLRRWSKHLALRRYRVVWVEATAARARGRVLEALKGYDQAVTLAREGGACHDAALICEQAADYCQKIGQGRLARAYLKEAVAFYRHWGAVGKADLIEPGAAATGRTGGPLLDLETVLRGSRVLSSEIYLPVLLREMLDLAMLNAGAERGWLLLRGPEGWALAAHSQVGHATELLNTRVDLDAPACPLPATVLRYASRTREALVVEDARASGLTRLDPYVLREQPHSILCLPLEHARSLVGLIYLENNRVTGVFTPQRTEVLRTLSAQMAICLENARHFAQVQSQHEQILAEREQRHLEELRGQALEARKEAFSAFLGIASHDLKTPLATIATWAHQLEPGPGRESIEKACRRALGLIGTYLDVVAVEAGVHGGLRLARGRHDLGELVEQEIDFLLHSLSPEERALANLEWDLEPLVLSLDRERLQQVIANLVGNALKYCPRGTAIRVRLSRTPRVARLEVEDEGPGLAPEVQQGLFQPFERRSKELAGSGLGLWICRVIVEAHGGRIGVQSHPEYSGSRFCCELPLIEDLPSG